MPDDRTYIRVHDGLDEHPKIEELSDAAFRLLMTTWFYCSRNRTDGRLTAKSWAKRGTPKARKELLAAGLIEQVDDHFQVHDYLEHQRSAAEIELLQSVRGDSGGYGNHVRWHVVRKKPKTDCQYCQTDPNGDRNGIANAIAKPSPSVASTEAETEEELQRGGTSPEQRLAEQTPHPPSRRCPAHLNDPAPPPCGRCKDARVAADTWQPPAPLRLVTQPCLIHAEPDLAHCRGCAADRKARPDQDTA